MQKTLAAVTVFFIFCLAAGLVMAQDLVGEWNEVDNWGARSGISEHQLGDGDFFLSMEKAGFTLKITEQSPDGRAFHGEWCSANKCEDAVGAVRSNGDIVIADEDGYMLGSLLGDTLELCYLEAGSKIRVANCRLMEK